MQKWTEVLSYEGHTPEQFTLLIGRALDSLHWPNRILENQEVQAEVKETPWSWGERMTVQVYTNQVWITSQYRYWQLPVGHKNQRNVEALKTAIDTIQQQYDSGPLADTENASNVGADEHLFDFEKKLLPTELNRDEAKKVSWGRCYVTYALAFIIVVVFALMVYSGVSVFAPTVEDLFKWGGNIQPYTTGGQYWRLITHLFVHVGIIHLVFNLIALISIGVYLEPLIGKAKLLLCFLLTGILAGTMSMWWNASRISAGASGAIFGLYGVFLVLLVTGTVGKDLKKHLLSSVCFFIGVNLIYGLKGEIDNAAHIGGLMSGMVLGFLMVAEVKWQSFSRLFKWTSIVLPLTIIVSYISVVHTQDADFDLQLREIVVLDNEADWTIASGSDKSDNQLAGEMERISIPKWSKVRELLQSYQPQELNTFNKKLHSMLTDYTQLRLKEAELYIQRVDDSTGFHPQELFNVKEQISEKKTEIMALKR